MKRSSTVLVVFCIGLVATSALADYVGTQINRLLFDPEGIGEVLDGYQAGDVISFIAETSPAPTGDRGIAAWSTIYIPPGVRVVDLHLVRPDGDGTYSEIPALDVAAAHDDCGNRGCAFPTTGTYQNGRVNEVQQDTGVFYSTDPRTALLATPLTANPTGVAQQNVWNQWDFDQTKAFGEGGAFSGNGGRGNTPVVQIGGTWFGTGSTVAGPDTYYQNDYNPSCDPGTGTSGPDFEADLGCTGPWQRIAHENAKIGGSGAIVPATTGAAAPLANTAVLTSAGHDFDVDGALPASTNAVRVVQGIRRVGDLETARITFEITDPVAFTAAFTNDTFCLDGTGGDLDKGDPSDPGRRGAQDSAWRYYEGNQHQCFEGSANGVLVKQPEFVNGVPSTGAAVEQDDVIGYAITFYNTTANTLFDIDFSDTAVLNAELVPASTAGCPYADYSGDQGGQPTLATLTAGAATWNRLDTLAAGQSVTVHMCARVTTNGTGDQVKNQGDVAFATTDGGVQETLTSVATSVVSTQIAGQVFADSDGDDAFSAGDTELAGITVRLYEDDGGGGLGFLLATTTTNTVGGYEFNGYPDGDYIVVAEDLPGYDSIRDVDTAPPCTANDCNEIAVTLAGRSTGNDFLDRPPVTITGTVFGDQNQDALFNLADRDFGQAGATVRLFRDANNDGVADSGTPEATVVTAADGTYEFLVTTCDFGADDCHFVLDVDVSTLPAGATLTTDNFEEADFTAFGQADAGNDFGFTAPPSLQVAKTSSGAGSDVFPGDTLTYTFTPRNLTSEVLTNVRVTDLLPPQTSFVGAGPTGFTGPDPVVWALGGNTPRTSGQVIQAPVTITGHAAVKGTFINQDKPDENKGDDAKISLKADTNKVKRGLVEWDLSGLGIPTGATVTSATMSFFVTDDKNVTAAVHRLNRSWVEGTGDNATGADWESPADDGNPPSTTWTAPGATGDFDATAIGSFSLAVKNVRQSVVATSLVQSWIAAPASNFGVILLPSGANGDAKFGSDDNAEPPRLDISYIPPGSTATILEAAGSLVGDGDPVTLTLTVRADDNDSSIDPPDPTVTGVNGASAVCDGTGGSDADWSPSAQSLATTPGTDAEVTFTRVCVASAGSLGGSVSFGLTAPIGDLVYAAPTGNSVLVTPDLTLTIQLDDPLSPWVPQLTNVVTLSADGTFDAVAAARDVISRGGTIGDRVWLDVDGDGVQDVGEPGIPNVTVTLYDAGGDGMPGGGDDVAIATTVTGAGGAYLFTHLTPGTYFVDVTDATVPADLTLAPGSADPSGVVTVTAEEIFLNLDFGYVPDDPGTAVIGDRVWSDADEDGVLDPGEVGIGAVTVRLLSAGPDGVLGTGDDVVEDTTTTAADGSYLFTGVAPGEYVVRVDEASASLSGYSFRSGPQSPSNASPPISVEAGDVYDRADFAYFNAATFSIADRVWLDVDGDGTQDPGEPGVAGVVVNLLDAGGNVIATALTDAAGDFSFAGVENGDYTLDVADTASVLIGLAGTTAAGTAFSLPVTVAGADVSAVSFGYNAPGVIGDTIFSDHDGDGLKDAGEPGIAGVAVELWLDADADGVFDDTVDTLLDTTATDAAGGYLFEGLLTGTYFVSVDDGQAALAGYAPTTTDQETGANAAGTQIEVSLATLAAAFLDADVGYQNTALPDVSGNVFEDLDADGFDDGAGEPGFDGVTLALIDAAGNTVATTTTDAAGDYTFFDVPPGDYVVAVTDDARVLDGYLLTSGLDRRPVTVAAADVTGIDFGYVRGAGTASIGDTVWLDADPPGAAGPDGLRGPNEAGLPGVTLSLYRDVDGDGVAEPGGDDGAAIATTTTDADGNYRFSGLEPGSYFVDVDAATLPANLAPTVNTTDPSSVVALSEGERHDDADFGYLPSAGTAVLGDEVWYDADADGLRDPGEVGIAGVTVNLAGAGLDGEFGTGDDFTATAVTAADGSYLFTGLPPDDYVVYFDAATLPAGYSATPTNTGPDSTYRVLLAAGDVLTHLDWGFNGGSTGAIGDRVWLDLDGDGAQDAGEPGLAGVTLDLVGPGPNMTFGDADDEILATTTTTGANGDYLFSGLPLGASYQVAVSDLGGVLDGLNLSSTLPGTLTPTAGTPNLTTADLGYAPSDGTGSLGSIIWRDLDFDGVRDPGEPPIQGVTLDVWLDTNGNGVIEPGTDNLVRTIATDENGEFEVKALPFGAYLVDVTDTRGVLAGMTKTTGPTPGADDNSQADPYAVVLSAGSPRDITADFGYRAAGAPLSISGTVFEDADVDAVYDGLTEMVVPSAAVTLYRVVGNRRFLVSKTVTDVNGFYSFGDLPPGNYEVAIDTTGTSVDGFLQTTQSSTGGVQPVTLVAVSSTGNDFGFYDGGVTTTPVTLSYFASSGDGGWAEIEWQTVTEVGHVGFNLWIWNGETWRRLNDEIIPSSGADALALRSYRFEAVDPGDGELLVEDLDILGVSRYHGPFELGEAYGRKDLGSEPIPWKAIRAEHAAREAERLRAVLSKPRHKARQEGSARLLVDAGGVHRVTYEELAAAGLDLDGAATKKIAVSSGGVAVPVRVEPKGRFGPGSFLEFVGEGLDTLYTRTNVYHVTADSSEARGVDRDGKRPKGAAVPFYTETLRVEHDREYSFAAPNGDPWYDTGVLAFGTPASASFSFETEDRVPGAGPATVTVGLWGVTDWHQSPDHHVVVEVNGVVMADEVFDGTTDYPITFEVPESVLAAGANELRVVLPADNGLAFELVNVDHFSVTYPRRFVARDGALTFTAEGDVFEVEGLPTPDVVVYRETSKGLRLLAGAEVTGVPGDYRARFPGDKKEATYHVASRVAVKTPGVEPGRPPADLADGPAELLVISHPDFLDGFDRLVDARRAQGWTVKVVDVEDVYAQYAFGVFDPGAIRDYVAFAHENLGTRAVLLVGGDTYDYHDVLGLGGVSFIPSLYGRTGQFVQYAPADGLYADIDGDEVPDLAIGRFPVRTAADLEAVVDKTLGYETRAARRSLVLVADDYDEPTRFDFAVTSEQLASLVPGDWHIDRVYADALGQAAARSELLSKLNAGPAITSFMGHSGPTTWSFDGLFSAGDAAALSNTEPTVVAQWGCWTTYYVSPFHETLGHKLLLSGDHGAAAVLGATTLTEARSERALALEIFRQLFAEGRNLGDAVLEAKRRLAAAEDPAVVDVLIGWNLLGDPTLGLQ